MSNDLLYRLLLNTELNRTHLTFFSQTILVIPTFITMCHESSHKVKYFQNGICFRWTNRFFLYSKIFQMVYQKDLFNHLMCIFSIKESFVSLSENIDIIELCYMLGRYESLYWFSIKSKQFIFLYILTGNIVALGSIDLNQIEAMKQPFIHCLFNILDVSRQRQIMGDQSEKQTKMTSIWHPIIGHVRGKTSGNTVLV